MLTNEQGVNIEPIRAYLNTYTCNCVDFIKQFKEQLIGTTIGCPFNLWKYYKAFGLEKSDGQIGDLVITKEHAYWGHIGLIASVSGDIIYVLDKNFKPCRVMYRELDKNSENIVGYLK